MPVVHANVSDRMATDAEPSDAREDMLRDVGMVLVEARGPREERRERRRGRGGQRGGARRRDGRARPRPRRRGARTGGRGGRARPRPRRRGARTGGRGSRARLRRGRRGAGRDRLRRGGGRWAARRGGRRARARARRGGGRGSRGGARAALSVVADVGGDRVANEVATEIVSVTQAQPAADRTGVQRVVAVAPEPHRPALRNDPQHPALAPHVFRVVELYAATARDENRGSPTLRTRAALRAWRLQMTVVPAAKLMRAPLRMRTDP